jgi:hypothetical protein
LPFVCSEVRQIDTLNAQEILSIDASGVELGDGPHAFPCETHGSVKLACGKQAAATKNGIRVNFSAKAGPDWLAAAHRRSAAWPNIPEWTSSILIRN